MDLCFKDQSKNQVCKPLRQCSTLNCSELGETNCSMSFSSSELRFGEKKNYFIKTYGLDQTQVTSDACEAKTDLDQVLVNDKLYSQILFNEDSITVHLTNENSPRGFFEKIQISCIEEADPYSNSNTIYSDCLNNATCSCSNLYSGTKYLIQLHTIRTGWLMQTVALDKVKMLTSKIWIQILSQKGFHFGGFLDISTPKDIKFDFTSLRQTNASISWLKPNPRFNGFIFRIEGRIIETCKLSDDSSNVMNRINCNYNGNRIFYEFQNLNPGSEYRVFIKTFRPIDDSTSFYSAEQNLTIYTGKMWSFF